MPESTTETRDTEARDKTGKWKKGQSGNPQGRPLQNVSRKLLMENAEDLTQKAINLAMDGDTTALSLCLNRIMPALKSCSPLIEVDTEGAGNMADRGLKIIDAATSGQLAPDLAGQLLQALGTLARIDELEDLRDRLTAIEDAMKQRKKETRT